VNQACGHFCLNVTTSQRRYLDAECGDGVEMVTFGGKTRERLPPFQLRMEEAFVII